MFLAAVCLRLLLVDRMARGIAGVRLVLRRRLTMMLLMHDARRPRMLQMGRNRTLLLVMGMMLHRGDNH